MNLVFHFFIPYLMCMHLKYNWKCFLPLLFYSPKSVVSIAHVASFPFLRSLFVSFLICFYKINNKDKSPSSSISEAFISFML